MARLRVTVEDTPNPNAMKFTTNRVLNAGPTRSYRTAEDAAADPLACRLFALPQVTGVMIVNDFCSVNKTPAGRWKTLIPRIQAILEEEAEHVRSP